MHPAIVAAATIIGTVAWAPGSLPPAPFTSENVAWVLTASPLLLVAGAASICVATDLTPWLPGRRSVKYLLVVAATALWAIGWALLERPGLIELP